jgi:hypothetical protein
MAYFANGSEGAYLDAQCSECMIGEDPCPVYAAQMEYNYDQKGKIETLLNLLIGEDCKCRLRPLLEKKQAIKLCPSCLEYDNGMKSVINQLEKRSNV